MPSVSPFRLTGEDLPDLDKKTRDGLQPLFDALNVTMGQLVPSYNATPTEDVRDVSLSIGAAVADSFPLKFTTAIAQPRVVVLANVRPKATGHLLTTPFVMQGFGLTGNGLVTVPWVTGLLPLNSYTLTFLVR